MARLSQVQLQEFFAAWSPRLTLYARTWLSHHAAEDAVQNAFIQLMKAPTPENTPAWLFRAVRNQAISGRRADSRRGARERTGPRFTAYPSAPLQPEELHAVLERLSESDREAIALRVWAGLSFEDMAWIWGSSASSAHRRYVAALEAVRARMEDRCRTIR